MFKNKYMSVIAYADGWTMWHYTVPQTDTLDDVLKPGYFEQVKTLSNTGDHIIVSTAKESATLVVVITHENKIETRILNKVEY